MNVGKPYTPEEVQSLRDRFPDRGIFCPECEVWIPRFAVLSKQEEETGRRSRHRVERVKWILQRTRCSLSWASIWAGHPDGPHPLRVPEGQPCPFCDYPLDPRARQCPVCKMDWHDPERPVQRSASLVDVIMHAAPGSTIPVVGWYAYFAARRYALLKRPDVELDFIQVEVPQTSSQ